MSNPLIPGSNVNPPTTKPDKTVNAPVKTAEVTKAAEQENKTTPAMAQATSARANSEAMLNAEATDKDAEDEIALLKNQLAKAQGKLSVYEQNEDEVRRVKAEMAKIKFYTLRRGASLSIDIPTTEFGAQAITFQFKNGALRLHDDYHIELFERELKTNIALKQAVYSSAQQHQQDIAARHAEREQAQKAVAMGAAGSTVEMSPAQQAELALRNSQATGTPMQQQAPAELGKVETT